MQSNTGSEEHLETPILQYAGGVIAAKLDRTEKELVHGVSFHISRGESLALIGETGSGKTLIAQSVMGVLPGNVRLVSGEVLFCGKALPKGKKLRSMLGREIVYIPQNGHEFLDPSRSIRRQMFDSIAKLGIAAPQREAFAREKLTQVGFTQPEAILDRYAFQLSGGMAQRVTIALALCSQAKLLIADEPTNGLDQDSKQQTLSLLNDLFPDAAKLVITHDISVAATCGRILGLCGKCWRLAAPHWCWLPRAIPTPKPCWVPWWKTGCRKRRLCGRRRALVPSIAAVPQPSDDAVPKCPGGRRETENGGAARNDLHGTDR
jgi:ABC-type dipeptide/oligopeptide/nickel transport system ATPase subunit